MAAKSYENHRARFGDNNGKAVSGKNHTGGEELVSKIAEATYINALYMIIIYIIGD